jgi:hypothetical protein
VPGVAAGLPSQTDDPMVLGAYAGYGPSLTLTTAHSMRQTGGPFTTWSANVGIGIAKGSIQLSYGGKPAVYQLTISSGPSPFSDGIGLSVSKVTTWTDAEQSGCR